METLYIRRLSDELSAALLNVAYQTVNSQLFQHAESRRILIQIMCKLVKKYLSSSIHCDLCADIVRDMLMFQRVRKNIDSFDEDIYFNDVKLLSELLMDPLMSSIQSNSHKSRQKVMKIYKFLIIF